MADASEEGVGDTKAKKTLIASNQQCPENSQRPERKAGPGAKWCSEDTFHPPSVTNAYLLVCIHGSRLTFTTFTVTVTPLPPPASPDKRRFSLLLLLLPPCKQWWWQHGCGSADIFIRKMPPKANICQNVCCTKHWLFLLQKGHTLFSL